MPYAKPTAAKRRVTDVCSCIAGARKSSMARILALEPYYGGSHRAFLDGWMRHSCKEFTLLTQSAHHWKWRMRHAAVSLASRARELPTPHDFDVVWASSMCNVAEFLGLCPLGLRQLPLVVYFPENQLAYPSQHTDPPDVHFAFTNWTSALAATEVWFNSRFNQTSLLVGLGDLFRRLPDHQDVFNRQHIEHKAKVLPPGIDVSVAPRRARAPAPARAPLHIAWAARFEHDKGPEVLLAALYELKRQGLSFELTVMGQQFESCPDALRRLQHEFSAELGHFGFEPNRTMYLKRLADADVFISTAHHEFFGLSVLEAAHAGCSLLLPEKLSYPELFDSAQGAHVPLFYDGSSQGLARELTRLAQLEPALRPAYRDVAPRYAWPVAARRLDQGIDSVLAQPPCSRTDEAPVL